jgi:hypothetical protein
MATSQRWVVKEHVESGPVIDGKHLFFEEAPLPALGAGEVVVKNVYISIDPTHRIWLTNSDQYWAAASLNEPMRALTLGVIEQSNSDLLKVGEHVFGLGNVQSRFVASAGDLNKIDEEPDIPLDAHISVLGLTMGVTAWVGVTEICAPKTGETFVVSGAAGAVGMVAGQIAKIHGARVVGICGSDEKAAFLINELGFDACVNYKSPNLAGQLRNACPNGIDSYFENTGGPSMEAALSLMNQFGRVAICGLISQYDNSATGAAGTGWGPSNFVMILHRRLKIQGFITSDSSNLGQAAADLRKWLKEGKLKYKLDAQEGIQNYVKILSLLFSGNALCVAHSRFPSTSACSFAVRSNIPTLVQAGTMGNSY